MAVAETVTVTITRPAIRPGILYAIGLGPGNPDWVTIEAATMLQQMQVVGFIASNAQHSRAETIARQYLAADCKVTRLILPLGHATASLQSQIADIVTAVNSKRLCAIACLGDPMLYGSIAAILPILPAEIKYKVIPGLSAGSAAGALLARAVVRYQQSLAIIPATGPITKLVATLSAHQAIIIVKLAGRFQQLNQALETTGRLQDAWIIEEMGTNKQRIEKYSGKNYNDTYFSMLLVLPPPT